MTFLGNPATNLVPFSTGMLMHSFWILHTDYHENDTVMPSTSSLLKNVYFFFPVFCHDEPYCNKHLFIYTSIYKIMVLFLWESQEYNAKPRGFFSLNSDECHQTAFQQDCDNSDFYQPSKRTYFPHIPANYRHHVLLTFLRWVKSNNFWYFNSISLSLSKYHLLAF